MNRHILMSLEKERGYLMAQWARATEDERFDILVKIMDLDERIEEVKREQMKEVAI